MASSFTFGIEDSTGGRSYHGATVGTALTPAQVTTFVNSAILPYVDGRHIQSAVKSTDDVTGSATTGSTGVERRGQVIMKSTSDGRRFVITLPSIKASVILPNGTGKASLNMSLCDAVISAFNTLTGISCVFVSSYADGSQYQR